MQIINLMLNIDLEHTLNKVAHDKRTSLICAVIISMMLIITVFSFLSIFNGPSKKTSSSIELSTALKKTENYNIPQHHLFGEFQETVPSIPSTAPSNFALQAIFYAENPVLKSSILISVNNDPGKLYYINDVLPNGARIQNILADKVIINHGGKLQTLELPIPKLEFAAPPENTLPKE